MTVSSRTAQPEAKPASADSKADAPTAHSNPIVAALQGMAVSVLTEQLREMFEKADDILFDSAEKARGGDEQRVYLDTMRIVRVQRAKIIKAFQEALAQALSKIGVEPADETAQDLEDINQWSLQDGDVLEERLAVSNMETKAASLHAHELVELQRRLSRLSEMSPGGVSEDSMSPARIIRAFQNSMKGLQVEFPIKLVIYKLFDRVVVGRLSEVFVGANQLLAVHGIEPKADASRDYRVPAGGGGASSAAGAAAPGGAPAWAAGLDASTLNGFMDVGGAGVAGFPPGLPRMGQGQGPMPGLLPSMAGGGLTGQPGMPGVAANWMGAGVSAGAWPAYGGAPGPDYSDALLAQDIAQILQSYSQGQTPNTPSWLPPQNVALVARMFDSYYRDPRLSEHLKPWLARLQMPVMKTALADPQFFSDPAHPARRTANDLFEMLLQFGSADAAPPPRVLNDLQGLIEEMAQAFSLDATKLKASQSAPVDDQTADSFLREQEEQTHQRNRAKLERVRRVVAHELRRQIGERSIPPGVMRLMLSGFGPLLCLDYIRSGVQGESWNQTMGLVERVLRSLEPSAASPTESATEEAEIVAALSRRLATIGFSESKLEEVLAGLVQAYLERPLLPSAPPDTGRMSSGTPAAEVPMTSPASTAAAPESAAPLTRALSPEKEMQGLLSIVLIPGGWFTVWDEGEKIKHWMRVHSYYPSQNTVMFVHYMDERYLRLPANAFATDLIQGRTAAIDPSRELQNAIDRLLEIPFQRASEAVVWVNADGSPTQPQ